MKQRHVALLILVVSIAGFFAEAQVLPRVESVECKVESEKVSLLDKVNWRSVRHAQGQIRRLLERSCGRAQYKGHIFYFYQYQAIDMAFAGEHFVRVLEIARENSNGYLQVVRSDRQEQIRIEGDSVEPTFRTQSTIVFFETKTGRPKIEIQIKNGNVTDRTFAHFDPKTNWFIDEL